MSSTAPGLGVLVEVAADERHAAAAVWALRRLHAEEYFGQPARVWSLVFDPGLNALRGRADFRCLLAGLPAGR